MGARELTAFGIGIGKIRILARHSGEAIDRYAGEAPLAALQADISRHLKFASSGLSTSGSPNVARPSAAVISALEEVRRQLERMEARLDASERRSSPCVPTVSDEAGLVLNATTKMVHRLRRGSVSLTLCGWDFGAARLVTGKVRELDNLADVPWTSLCSRCLFNERESAMSGPGAFSDSGSCSD